MSQKKTLTERRLPPGMTVDDLRRVREVLALYNIQIHYVPYRGWCAQRIAQGGEPLAATFIWTRWMHWQGQWIHDWFAIPEKMAQKMISEQFAQSSKVFANL